MIFDVIVIGGGPVGMFGAYLADHKGLKTCLIEANEFLGGQPQTLYSQKKVYDFPCQNGVMASEIVNKIYEQLLTSNCVIKTNVRMIDFKRSNGFFDITLSNGELVQTKSIIISTGGGLLIPNKLMIDNVEIKNGKIDYAIKNIESYKNKNVVILGGGDSAVDWANEFYDQHITGNISIIHRRESFRAKGTNVNNLLSKPIKVYLNQAITKCDFNTITFKDNTTGQENSINYDAIIVQYGQTIDIDAKSILKNFNLDRANRIIVSQNMQSNIENIYAAGNVCSYPSKPNLMIAGMGEITIAVNDIINKRNDE